jgi:hypothetical protein
MHPVSAPDESDGFVRVDVTGGAGENRYVWIDAAADTISSTDYKYSSVITDQRAGKYTLFVTDKYDNTISTEVDILAPSEALRLDAAKYKDQDCNEISDGYVLLSAVGGWGDYRYAHYVEAQADSNISYSNMSMYSNLSAGEHYFYTVDKYGKRAELTVTIGKPDVLRAAVAKIEDVKCKDGADGQILFNIFGGNNSYYLREKGANFFWIAGNTATDLPAGVHTFEFTDNLDCVCADTISVTITEPDSLLFESIDVTHTICAEDNGKIITSLKGGTRPYSYEWRDGQSLVVGADSVITNLKQSAQYRLFVTDGNGCTQYLERFIESSSRPRITEVEISPVLCYGGSTGSAKIISVEASVPYAPCSFVWSNGSTDSFAENLSKGRYSITVEDTNGCYTAYYLDVTQPDSLYLLIAASKDPHCFGYSDGWIKTETRGGKGAYTYLWSTGATTSDIDSLINGDYHVRVTDENGCYYDREITLVEPSYQSIYLGDDVVMCPGNTHVIDGGDYKSYRWYTDSSDNIFSDRYFGATQAAHYYLEAKDERDCSAWGDVDVTIGSSALIADMLLPSEAEVGDTIYVIEISNINVDRIEWLYDSVSFSHLSIEADDIYSGSHILPLLCNEEGVYIIGLNVYSGGCYSPASKEIEIISRSDTGILEAWGMEPLIKKAGAYPNPTTGDFTVEIKLRERHEVNLKLFDLVSGTILSDQTVKEQDNYTLNYNKNRLSKGQYVLTVTAGSERRQVKIIVQ